MKPILVKQTKYANKCEICHKWIPAGSPSYWEKELKRNYHIICWDSQAIPLVPKAEPLNGRQASKGPGSASQASAIPSALTLDTLSSYLKAAIAECEANDALKGIDTETLIPLAAEYMRGLLQKQEQEFAVAMSNKIQASKEKNMSMIK